MRKHFLLLFLMALLPLSGWAVSFLDETVTVSANDAAFNTAIATIKDGITVKINNEPLGAANWDWDGKFYATSTAAAAEDAEGLVAAATGSTTPGVNTYYIRIVPTTAANSDYKVIPLIIKKANIENADFVAPVGYDGLTFISKTSQQDLIKIAGTCAKGTFEYSLDGTTWKTNKADIKAINAGNHKVYYRIKGSANYNDRVYVDPAVEQPVALSITVNIAQKALPTVNTTNYTFTAPATTPIYNGAALTGAKLPTFTAKDGSDDLVADAEGDYTIAWHKGAVDGEVGAPTGAGTYYLVITGTGNYTGEKSDETNWKFSVARKPISVYVEDAHMTYNGAAIPTVAAVAASPAGYTLTGDTDVNPTKTYYTKEGSVYTEVANPDATQIGTYYELTTPAVAASPFHIDIPASKIKAPGLATVDAGLKDDLYAKFELAANNTTVPQNYAAEGYAMVAFAKDGSTLTENYEPDYSSFGAYYIDQRDVTVTVLNQGPFTYTGENIATSIGDTRADQTIWLKFTEMTTSPAVDGTVTIEKATYENTELTNNTGVLTGETLPAGLVLKIKDGVTVKLVGTVDGTYKDVIEIDASASTLATSNYKLTVVKGSLAVAGKALKVAAKSFEKTYGYTLDFTQDFGYRTNPANIDLKDKEEGGPTVAYTVKDATTEEDYTNFTGVLPAGTYTIAITPNEALTPDNYEITAYMEGELVINQKVLNIAIEPVSLNTGDGLTELQKYASVDDAYKADLVDPNADIAFTIEFVDDANLLKDYDEDLTDDVHIWGLKSAAEYTTLQEATTINYWDAVTSTLTGVTKLVFDAAADANKNYDIRFTPGNIVLGGAKTLKLDITSDQLAGKIADAAAACAADPENVFYNVTFGAKEMVADEWYPVVLPFATSAYELVKQLGQYVVLNTYDAAKSTPIDIKFTLQMGDIPAGVPFLIKAGAALNWNNKAFNTKTIVAAPKAQGNLDDNGSIFTGVFSTGNVLLNGYELDGTTADANLAYRWLSNSTDTEGWTTKGNYWRGATADDHHKRNLSALEAYLQIKVGTNARITVEDFDGQTTSIKTLSAGDMKAVVTDGWYTIDGIKLQSAPTQKGIYINNGKKVVLK